MRLRFVLGLILAGGCVLVLAQVSLAQEVVLLPYAGPISPASAEYLTRGIAEADAQKAAAVLIELDTPGGLDSSMRQIVQVEMNSPVPVVVFVAPAGARAASAGCIIALGADVIAMAPGTNIGAAHPVYASGGAVSEKIVNDAAAYARSLASVHGRNVEWAERAVRESVSASPQEAVQLHVADLTPSDLPHLLAALNGRTIRRANGEETLALASPHVDTLEMDAREKFLGVLTNPTVAYLLLLLGVLAIVVEIFAPHGFVTGTIGFVAFVLALVGLMDLPVQVVGLALLLLGMVLLGLELKITSHGALSLGGLVAFVFGSVLMLPRIPGYRISPFAIGTAVLLWALMIGVVVRKVVASRHQPVLMGVQRMSGSMGVAKTEIAPRGVVLINGEDWNALADASPIAKGDRVTVVSVEGLTLHVRKSA
ncbi:MAG TPA: NfeD family protein [Candidatus Limnocylindrales bacterium]|nr:NfeD family protein [Candidatus Limnocylindrales bacterium]